MSQVLSMGDLNNMGYGIVVSVPGAFLVCLLLALKLISAE